MRALFVLAVAALFALLLAGCGAGSLLDTDISMDADLNAFRLEDTNPMSKDLGTLHVYEKQVDLTTKSVWNQYRDRIDTFRALSLAVVGTNNSGPNPASPVAVPVSFYVSNSQIFTYANIPTEGTLVMTETIPAQVNFSINPVMHDLTPAAKLIVNDGQFWAYAVTDVSRVNVTASVATMGFKVRVRVID